MPITHLHAITQTLGSAIDYCSKNKVEEIEKNDLHDSLVYARNDKTGEITYFTITSTLNCPNGDKNVEKDFEEIIKKYNDTEFTKRKRNENQRNPLAWHLVQSFDGYIPPLLANQIGRELAEELLGNKYRVQISTHTNTDNIHNHIIFCAWDNDGKKYHDCHKNTNRIREISDKLAEKYGIKVLEETRMMSLVKWVDEAGKTHYYEPTDRKNKLIEQRKENAIKDDVLSYRFSDSYEEYMRKNMSLKDVVRSDIEMVLPYAFNYEHLLALLRENFGYEINDKKKNGQWKEHVSFKPVGYEKSVRDSSLDRNGEYVRERLTARIAEMNLVEREEENEKSDILDKPETSPYQYGSYDVKNMSENSYHDQRKDEEIIRGDTQRKTVKETKSLDKRLYDALNNVGYSSKGIDEIIRQCKKKKKNGNSLGIQNEDFVRKSINDIQNRLDAIWFMEKSGIQTPEDLKIIVRKYMDKYDQSFSLLRRAELTIKKIDDLVEIPNKLSAVNERIEKSKDDPGYEQAELQYDLEMKSKYETLIEKYKLTGEDLEKLKEKLETARAKHKELEKNLSICQEQVH